MRLIAFVTSVIARTVDDRMLIALLNGEPHHECVGLFVCSDETARGLCERIGSALKDEQQE